MPYRRRQRAVPVLLEKMLPGDSFGADAYIRLPSRRGYVEWIWDHAPGALIAAESGCAVTDALGNPLDFSCGRGLEKNRGILAAPARVHGLLVGAVKALSEP